ncbi:NuA4 histone acetyltransferase subunit [Blastocladiella emersonii ATCC 22665]|nr:NuA4 histone acetyltransferase subunit [Blastocladiella emersonii ATCC 22665]
MAATYGGDEVGALVLDVGSTWTKAGYAGEDTPDAYFPSTVGYTPGSSAGPDANGDVAMDEAEAAGSSGSLRSGGAAKWYVGEDESNYWRPHMEVRSPLTEGVVTDWDAFEHLLNYTFRRALRVDPQDHPLLMVEPSWNPRDAREKLAELAFETMDFPAFYLAKSAVLATFAAGKGSGLVVECGGGVTSVVPVHEGYALKKAVAKQPYAGEFLSHQAALTFGYNKIDICPQYLIAGKKQVPTSLAAAVVRRDRPNTHPTYHHHQLMRTFHDFKASVCATSERPFVEPTPDAMASLGPGRGYEFPDGYNNIFVAERFRVPEALFQPAKYIIPSPGVSAANVASIPTMLRSALEATDADLRPGLLANLVCTGGTAQLPGFTERIANELSAIQPGAKVKLISGAGLPEKKFGAWLGGSILASLGTFHQLWVSKKDYEEHGARIVETKCL